MMAKPAHLVISDFNMPKLDGIGFLRAVRANAPTQKCRLHHADRARRQGLIERAAKYGVNNYLVKPFTMPTLKSAIEAVLGKLK